MSFKEVLLSALLPTLESIGESALLDALQQLRAKDVVAYKSAIDGGLALVSGLTPITSKSKTPIDDAILVSIGSSLESSKTTNSDVWATV